MGQVDYLVLIKQATEYRCNRCSIVIPTMEAGSVYVDAGAIWSDAVDGNGTLTGVGQVNYLVPRQLL